MTHARTLAAVTIAVVVSGLTLVAGTKVKVLYDKTFNFDGLRTYAWRLDDASPVKMLQNTEDDPVQIRKTFEPLVVGAVDQLLAKRGFTKVPLGEAALYLDYYLLIGPGMSSQYQGQFIGAVPAWGLPDFVQATTALKVYEQGSLILDFISAKDKVIVWRGSADAEVDRNRTDAKRTAIVSDAIAKMLEKFPPKFKK